MAAVLRLLLLLLGIAALLPCVATLDILQAGSDILANHYLQSGNFYLVMQLDCNLVIYQGVECCSNPTWSTGTWNLGAAGDGCVASMQQDRNFVVYGFVNNVKTALWDTQTELNNATGAYYVILGNDGSLKVMEIGSPDVIWTNVVETGGALSPSPRVSTGAPAPSAALAPASQSASNVTFLTPESKVVAGLFLANEDVRLTLELDCNLQSRNVLRGNVVWETGSHTSQGGCELVLQKDSTLLIRIQSSGAVIWKSNTRNPKNAVAQFLFLREDGTVAVISTNGEEIWSLGKTDHSPSKRLAGVIVGTTGGILGGIILLGVTLCILMQYGYFDKDQKELQLRLLDKGGRSRALTLRQLKKATNNNERLLGRGGFGPVYYGRLQDGQEVAVKVLSATSNQGKQEFFNEIELLSVVHHKFLVSLVGYCIQRKQRILVYEYMSGGDVQNRLHGETASTDPLSWSQRKNIILQVAEGIQYLHEGCKPAIIHRDIKTNNILLDERMVAKVADFGLSKLLDVDRDDATHITTAVKGTTGYLDPEYYVSQKLTEKSDVYAYGILLMQIITGRSILDSVDNMYIVQKVRIAWKSKELDNLADPNLGGNYDHKELSGLVKLSLWCVKQSSSDRPSMSEVVHELREIGLSLSGTSHPSEAVVGEDYKIEIPYPLQTESSSSNLKDDMSDPFISAFSVSSSSGSAPGGPLLRGLWS